MFQILNMELNLELITQNHKLACRPNLDEIQGRSCRNSKSSFNIYYPFKKYCTCSKSISSNISFFRINRSVKKKKYLMSIVAVKIYDGLYKHVEFRLTKKKCVIIEL